MRLLWALLVSVLLCCPARSGPLDPPARVEEKVAAPVQPLIAAPPNVATVTEVQKATDDTKKAIEDSKKIPPAEDSFTNLLKWIGGVLAVLLGNYLQSHWSSVFGSKVVQDVAAQIVTHVPPAASVTALDVQKIIQEVTANVIKEMKGIP